MPVSNQPLPPRPKCVGGTDEEWEEYWTLSEEFFGRHNKGTSENTTGYTKTHDFIPDPSLYDAFLNRRVMKNGELGVVV